ncbi:MAG: hypothetical protein JRI68_28230 [Deltaproteobacteria bacterium]|nr:hypothetical protein [Deltaproteobacteria bacterium]
MPGSGGTGDPLPPRLIADEAGLAALQAMIPKQRIQMKQPAPPSEDPLLGKSPIHFDQHVLLVAFRTTSMYVGPTIQNVRRQRQGALSADVVHPPLGATTARSARVDIGTYHAVLLERGPEQLVIHDPKSGTMTLRAPR